MTKSQSHQTAHANDNMVMIIHDKDLLLFYNSVLVCVLCKQAFMRIDGRGLVGIGRFF